MCKNQLSMFAPSCEFSSLKLWMGLRTASTRPRPVVFKAKVKASDYCCLVTCLQSSKQIYRFRYFKVQTGTVTILYAYKVWTHYTKHTNYKWMAEV